MTKGIEIPADQLKTILSGGREQTPLHTVVTMDDRRMNPFLSMEEFEKKWALQFEVIENEISLEEYSDETKKKKGIPLNAQSGKNGWWYVGQTPVGKTVKGKFVPMIKIKAALKQKQNAAKIKKAWLAKKKKKVMLLKKKNALALKKKKAALLKKKKTTAKKKTLPKKTTKSSEPLLVKKYNRLKNDPNIKDAVYNGDSIDMEDITSLTGLTKDDLLNINDMIAAAGGDETYEGIYISPDGSRVSFGQDFGATSLNTVKIPKVKPLNIGTLPEKSTPQEQYKHYSKIWKGIKDSKESLKTLGSHYKWNPGYVSISMDKLTSVMGITTDDVLGLIKYLNRSDDYEFIQYSKYNNTVAIDYSYGKGNFPKPKKDFAGEILKTNGATQAEDIKDSYLGKDKLINLLKKKKIISKVTLSQVDKEAREHGKIIQQAKEQIQEAVLDWMEESVWSYSASRRQQIFKQINNIITHHKPRLTKTKQVFRGVSFDGSSAFFKKYLSQFKVGETIKLPPAGYSVDPKVAAGFAVDNDVKIMIRVKPSGKTGIKGLSVWESGNGYKTEREIITSGGQYKVDEVVYHNLIDAGGKLIIIDLTQIDDVNENTEIDTTTDDMETINGIMFGDNMRNTAKNMKKLSGKPKTKQSN
jgi:hypothetical protein